ncbi:hypothetical protein [Wenjunlia tyrosinilytica]|uniref:Uncharacterized protein n=1 Tax=Wenjunlia tyrosinilytica TaxID=1544741 RepID=A0A917ZYF0_9ACTN|nr:hypothetical protein [Wenjunlia tyrosinilytica]GGO98647.1 hypothetical protein GCM10012280_63270 [Wenjunlia tyrosinilytica]
MANIMASPPEQPDEGLRRSRETDTRLTRPRTTHRTDPVTAADSARIWSAVTASRRTGGAQ